MKQGRSTGAPTKAEAARIVAAKEGPCMACFARAESDLMSHYDVVYGCDYNHAKSGIFAEVTWTAMPCVFGITGVIPLAISAFVRLPSNTAPA